MDFKDGKGRPFTCAMCGEESPNAWTDTEARHEAERNFGYRPDAADAPAFTVICHDCFETLTVCVVCDERWLSTSGSCIGCGSSDVRRGQASIDYDKARGLI